MCQVEARPGRLVVFHSADTHAFRADGHMPRAMIGPIAFHNGHLKLCMMNHMGGGLDTLGFMFRCFQTCPVWTLAIVQICIGLGSFGDQGCDPFHNSLGIPEYLLASGLLKLFLLAVFLSLDPTGGQALALILTLVAVVALFLSFNSTGPRGDQRDMILGPNPNHI